MQASNREGAVQIQPVMPLFMDDPQFMQLISSVPRILRLCCSYRLPVLDHTSSLVSNLGARHLLGQSFGRVFSRLHIFAKDLRERV